MPAISHLRTDMTFVPVRKHFLWLKNAIFMKFYDDDYMLQIVTCPFTSIQLQTASIHTKYHRFSNKACINIL